MENRIVNKKVSLIPVNQLTGPIYFGWSLSPFGQCFVLLRSNAIIGLAFKNDQTKNQIETTIKARWLKETKNFKPLNADKKAENIFFDNSPIEISFSGNQLQTKVWKALIDIPMGETSTYSFIASKTGNPKAVRAVATAIGKNPIAWLIPCHRVIRKSGEIGGYRWGEKIKKMILSNEIKL